MFAIAKASRITFPGLCLILACLCMPLSHAQSAQPKQVMHSVPSADATQPAIGQDSPAISLASAPRPRGQILARHSGDSTFEHVPANYHVFAAANGGEDAGVETLTLNFAADTRLTRIESKNKDFVVERGGTCHEGNFYARGNSCTLSVRFNPQGPGHRLGFITVTHSAAASPMFVGLTGNGYAPVISFTPARIITVPGTVSAGTGTINGATNMAIDGGDILYIADIGNTQIKEIDSSGVINHITPVFANPASLAADSAGILYSTNVPGSTYYFSIFFPWGVQSSYGTTYAPGACTPSTPCPLTTVGMSQPANMSIDAYDNLFFEERTKGAAEMPVSGLAGGSGALNLWYLTNQFVYTSGTPSSFAVDANGNLYNRYNWSTTVCYLQEEPLYNAEYSPVAKRVAGGVACGFSGDGGPARSAEISSTIGQIAFDVAGDLYFADAGNQRVRRIDAATGIIRTIAGTGTAGYNGDGGMAINAALRNPSGLAVDSQGGVYVLMNSAATGTAEVIRKIGPQGYLSFGNELHAVPSPPRSYTITNIGNAAMIFTGINITGTNAADFKVDPNTTTCLLTPGATLASGQSCKIGLIFTPGTTGLRTATLNLLGNTINGLESATIVGIGI